MCGTQAKQETTSTVENRGGRTRGNSGRVVRRGRESKRGGGQTVGVGSGYTVLGSGFRVLGSGIRVQGSGFRVSGSGVWGSGSREFKVRVRELEGLDKLARGRRRHACASQTSEIRQRRLIPRTNCKQIV
eukprot:1198286-Rhodomonas_salina.1